MTPNEIKKALECCSEHEGCHNCPCKNECGDLSVVTTEALNLINRQQVEIERLEKHELSEAMKFNGDGYDDKGNLIYDTAYCPTCDKEFEVYYYSGKCCDDCGQALDWSDIE